MSRIPSSKWYFAQNDPLGEAFHALVNVQDTVFSFSNNGEECTVYYAGESLYKIKLGQRPRELALSFDMGHFRFWNGASGVPVRKGQALAPEFEEAWDAAWGKIDADLQPRLNSALQSCGGIVSIRHSIREYQAKEHYKKGSGKLLPWGLTAKITDLAGADLFIDQLVEPLMKQAIKEFQEGKNRQERVIAQEIQNRCDGSSFAKGETPLFFADCEYKQSKELLTSPTPFSCESDKMGKPDGIGLLRYQGRERPCIIEIKLGTKALSGKSGISKHLRDMSAMVQDDETLADIRRDICFAMTQKDECAGRPVPKHIKERYRSIQGEPLLLFIMCTGGCGPDTIRKKLKAELEKQRFAMGEAYPETLFAMQEAGSDPLALEGYTFYRLTAGESGFALEISALG